jgi:hypothetical protein
VSASGPPVATSRVHVYLLSSLLIPGQYYRPVYHRTQYYCTGWGHRACSLVELQCAHGFPRTIPSAYFDNRDFTLPPVQLLAALFDPTLEVLGCISPNTASMDLAVLPPSITTVAPDGGVVSHQTWLPTLGRFLSHAWLAQDLIEEKVNRDDAPVPSQLWDNCLHLLFPGILPLLPLLRNMVLRWYRRRLFREFVTHINRHHGHNWVTMLPKHRRLLRVHTDTQLLHGGGGTIKYIKYKHRF